MSRWVNPLGFDLVVCDFDRRHLINHNRNNVMEIPVHAVSILHVGYLQLVGVDTVLSFEWLTTSSVTIHSRYLMTIRWRRWGDAASKNEAGIQSRSG